MAGEFGDDLLGNSGPQSSINEFRLCGRLFSLIRVSVVARGNWHQGEGLVGDEIQHQNVTSLLLLCFTRRSNGDS